MIAARIPLQDLLTRTVWLHILERSITRSLPLLGGKLAGN